MAKKKIKKEKISAIAVSELGNKAIFFCHTQGDRSNNLSLCGKSGDVFREITGISVILENGKAEDFKGCSDFRIFHSGAEWYLFYQRKYSKFFYKREQTVIAKSHDMVRFHVIDREDGWDLDTLTVVSRHRHKNNFLAYMGGDFIRVAASNDLKRWHVSGAILSPRKDFFDDGKLHVIDALTIERGILVIYESRGKKPGTKRMKIGAALFSLSHPYKLVWRSEEPIFEKTFSKGTGELKYLGCISGKDALDLYWVTKKSRIIVAKIRTVVAGIGSLKKRPVHLSRHHSNPIITPRADNSWEYDATFNPAAVHLEDKVHLIYRAIGANGVSVFGYAASSDGFTVDERLDKPAFAAMDFFNYSKEDQALYPSKYVSGGSWIGCEDPRITMIDDRIYMTYTSFDGWTPPGVALTWISVKDFMKKKWSWKRPVLISKPGEIQKNWMLFPEKINGKYAVLHSITPHISIEYVDDLEKDGLVIESSKKPGKDEGRWDNIVRGAGAPPLKTEYGWLVLYHAMDRKDPNRYKVGAMILDHDDPTKILYRSDCPVLQPDASYENEGAKSGVVYVCGAVIKDDTLFVYYGGADSVVCVATADIKEFLKDIACESAKNLSLSGKKKVKNIKSRTKISTIRKAKNKNKIAKKVAKKKTVAKKVAAKRKTAKRSTVKKMAKKKDVKIRNKKK